MQRVARDQREIVLDANGGNQRVGAADCLTTADKLAVDVSRNRRRIFIKGEHSFSEKRALKLADPMFESDLLKAADNFKTLTEEVVYFPKLRL